MSSADSKDCDATRPCSYCKREIAPANFVLHEAHCMRHIALCPQCKEPVPKAQLQEHIAEEHSKVPCALCGQEFEKHVMEDHKVNNCGQRLVTCLYCEIEMPVSKMHEHEDACGSRTEKCLTCQSYIMIKHTEEHKLSNCKPPKEEEEDQVWEPEEESPNYGYVDEYEDHWLIPPQRWINSSEKEIYEDHDGMLPCEFCGRPFPFNYLIQHQSGCDQNAMQGKAFSSAHPYLPEYDIHEDEMHDAFPKLMDLRINPSNKDVRNEENNLRPENHENRHRLPSNEKLTADHASSIQSAKSTVEKKKFDESHNNMDSESAQTETATVEEDYTSSVDVIPCEFCDYPIELDRVMEHQRVCRWMHPSKAFRQEHRFTGSSRHYADNGECEDDFDESATHYQHGFQGGHGPNRGYTNGNTKWTYERTTMNKYPNTEKRSHWERDNNRDSASETSSYQPRSTRGQPGYRNYDQERRQTYAEGEPHKYKARTDYPSSRHQHEEQNNVRSRVDFDHDNLRQGGQRDEQGTMRHQREDTHWSRGHDQRDRPGSGRQARNDDPGPVAMREESDVQRSKVTRKEPDAISSKASLQDSELNNESRAPVKMPDTDRSRAPLEEPDIARPKEQKQEKVNTRPEGQNGTGEQRENDRGYRPQPRRQQVGDWPRRTSFAEGEVVSQSTRVRPDEEDWRRKRPTDVQDQARFSRGRGRGRPAQNHSNTRSQRDEELNATSNEPAANTRTDRTQGGQTQQNLRHEEGQEARPRGSGERGRTRSGRRGRGQYSWRQERWNRTKGQAEEDYYDAPWPRRSNRDHNE